MPQGRFGLVLWATEIGALTRFLVEVAGADVLAQHPGYAELTIDDTLLTLHADEAGAGHPWYDALAREGVARGIGAELRVRVPDVAAAHRHGLALGALQVIPPYDAGPTRESALMGPDGYLLTLWQETPADGAPLPPPPAQRHTPFASHARPVIRRRF